MAGNRKSVPWVSGAVWLLGGIIITLALSLLVPKSPGVANVFIITYLLTGFLAEIGANSDRD